MPYIKQERRNKIDTAIEILCHEMFCNKLTEPGDLNYVLTSIINTFINSITVKFVPAKVKIKTVVSGIVIEVDKGFREITSLPSASYITDKGKTIPWLRWLLLEGDITIGHYVFRTTPIDVVRAYSRTGLGLMFVKRSGRWTMPPEFAGTEQNNFITRAIAQVRVQIEETIVEIIKRYDC